jgi:hypothetical protein
MFVKRPALLSGEAILSELPANFIINISQYGLSRFCADGLMWTVGLQGKEALGGRLFVTNYRVIFATHPLNRVTGEISIPLDIVSGVQNRSVFIMKRVAVLCALGELEFVVWNVGRFMACVEEGRRVLDVTAWRAVLQAQRDVLRGSTMHIQSAIEGVNRALNAIGAARKTVESAINPLEFLREALIEAALEKFVKEPVNRYVDER